MEVKIDFDEASKVWRSNKIFNKNGTISYKCTYIHSNGKRCSKPIQNNNISIFITLKNVFCKQHNRRKYDENINVWC